jgi:hypothetical protein
VKYRVRNLSNPTPKPRPEQPPLSGPKSPLPTTPPKSDRDTNSVSGRQGKGKLGTANVTLDFFKGGDFAVSGELEGFGKWTQTGNAVTMETSISKFQGVIDGNKAKGKRVRRSENGEVTTDEWSIDLDPPPAPDVKNLKTIEWVAGAWKWSDGKYNTFEFGKDGVGTGPYDSPSRAIIDGDEVVITTRQTLYQSRGPEEWTFRGTIRGDSIVGRSRFPDGSGGKGTLVRVGSK